MNPSAGTQRTCFIQKDMCKIHRATDFSWMHLYLNTDQMLAVQWHVFIWNIFLVWQQWEVSMCTMLSCWVWAAENYPPTPAYPPVIPITFQSGNIFIQSQVARKKEWKWWWSGSWLKRRIGGRQEDKNKTSCFNVSSKNIYSEQGESIIGKIKWSKF